MAGTTNTTRTSAIIRHANSTGGTGGGVGLGTNVDLELENATSGVYEQAGRITSIWTTIGAATEDADLRFSVMQGGALTLIAQLDADEDELEVSGGIESTGAIGAGVDAPGAGAAPSTTISSRRRMWR